MENKRIVQLKEFLKQTPEDPFLYYALGIEYVGLGNDGEALVLFKKLLQDHPNYSATYYHMGKLHERAGDKTGAEDIYRQGITLTQKSREQHALAELQTALNNMLYDD